jgi:hypothetical protein
MKKSSLFLVFVALFYVACITGRGVKANAIALKRGRSLNALLSSGQGDSLYQMMTPKFQAAVNGKEGFEKLMLQLPEELGKELTVEKEAYYEEAGFTSYYRISKFEKSPSVTTRFVWKKDELHGLTVRPTVQPAKSDYLTYVTKTPLQLPFKGEWYVAWGGREHYQNKHVVAQDQRFAYDLMYAEAGKLSTDTPAKPEDYFGFGKPIFSPAAGNIIVAVDSIEDNRLGVINSKLPAGNYVVIDHGNGEFSFLAHFKRGTVAVKEGSPVRAGDLLGQCGNSGQSTVPHLHYHLQTGKDYSKGDGLPILFHNYRTNGVKVATGEPVRGQYISPLK